VDRKDSATIQQNEYMYSAFTQVNLPDLNSYIYLRSARNDPLAGLRIETGTIYICVDRITDFFRDIAMEIVETPTA
jgi:hypothetical protein